MPIFLVFVCAGVLFDGTFSLWVPLMPVALVVFIKTQFYIRRSAMNSQSCYKRVEVGTLPYCVLGFVVNKAENHKIIHNWSKEINLDLRWCDIKYKSTKTQSFLINNNNIPIWVKTISLPMKIYDRFSWFLLLICIVHIHSSHVF